ncbi:SIR2 family protein [Cupriavidus alkaliphilus]|uniref:SIR2 family protein n=1 Tax=Cupriavidus alkaliphilus TaxID=942866 RepID=UPI000815E133|nr:SIR2 family protein [Cupriavidus alkaliphilus]SCB31654.1 SIR2-like domain-containing protein [Cupriavidus alkaliphilus]
MIAFASAASEEMLLADVIRHIATRNSILFLGSGFSASARGIDNEEMPLASNLAQKIADLQNFDAEKDLRYASSRYLDSNGDKGALIKLLRETFSVSSVEDHHVTIASMPWRRVYTTNYDMCFERAAEKAGKIFDPVDLSSNPSEFSARNSICVHLNGSLRNLSPETLNNDFKLTNSSYLSPDSFLTSKWRYQFQRDLDFSSAIIFVGYSMYDIEVQKILHSNPTYREKTFFITRSLKKGRDQFTIEQFGSILPIGVEAFAKALAQEVDDFIAEPEELVLASLWEYQFSEDDIEIRDVDVDTFLMRGEASDEIIDAAVVGAKGAPLLISRDDIEYAKKLLDANAKLVVVAEFGNGKSTFIRALRSQLALNGVRVFTADQADAHQHDDLETIVKKDISGCLIIDSYEQNIDLLSHYAELRPEKLKLIIAARTSIHERFRPWLVQVGLELNEISLDDLSPKEADQFIEIMDNIGYWGEKAALPLHSKQSIVNYDHHRQLSLNLLSLLSSPQMIDRVRELMSGLLSNSQHRDTIFSIALLAANDRPLNSSLISEIALNDAIYSSELLSNESFRQIFRVQGVKIAARSSIFAISIISQQFQATYIVDQLLKIVSAIDDGTADLRDIQKSLLRFSVVERFLPAKQRMQNLVRYYENLKREISWLKTDPHFWLQYGMAQLTYKHYAKAQGYFDQAYALAEKKHNYHTDHLDTQQARLFLLQSISVEDSARSFQLFADGHRLLRSLADDVHKYRQVEIYNEIFDKKFAIFSKTQKATFERACKTLHAELTQAMSDIWPGSRPRIIIRVADMLEAILSKIKVGKK